MTIWLWFTIAVGVLVGTIAAAVAGRDRRPALA
jgi:hypothetical protein